MQRYEVRAAADRGELYLYGDIGESMFGGISADQVRKDLKALGPKVRSLDVYVNSPGGDVFDGVAMHSVLSRFGGEVRMHVDGLAASAASVVLMAGHSISVADGAMIMVHEAWGGCIGPAADLRAYADTLDRVCAQMVQIYSKRTGLPAAKVAELMAAETWMSGDEAVALGFADEVAEGRKVAAYVGDLSKFQYRRPPALAAGRPIRDRHAAQIERVAALVTARRASAGIAPAARSAPTLRKV